MTDAGSIVLGWLTKLVVSLSILGLIVFDGLALLTGTINAADHANHAASIAADTYRTTKDVQAAYDAAEAEALRNNERVDTASFKIDPQTGRASVTLQRTATTLWMHHIGFLKKYTEVEGSGEGSPEP